MSRCILNIVPYDVKLIFRKCEKSNKKYIDLVMHREFNKICLKENLLPNYSDMKRCQIWVAYFRVLYMGNPKDAR